MSMSFSIDTDIEHQLPIRGNMNWTSLFLFISGTAAAVYGIHQIYNPLSWVVGGFLILRVAYVADERTTP